MVGDDVAQRRVTEQPTTEPSLAVGTDGIVQLIESRLRARTSRGVADAIRGAVVDGTIAPGDALPTVRFVAAALGLSSSAISNTWASLREEGLIETHRRGGSFIAQEGTASRSIGRGEDWQTVDFVSAHPYPEMQPDLHQAFNHSLRDSRTNSTRREFITDQLQAAARATWPFKAESWSTLGGAGEAVVLAIEASAAHGSTIAIEEPATPVTIGTLRSIGYTVVGVQTDSHGPTPESLTRALIEDEAAVFVYQPNGSFSLNSTVTESRLAELAEILEAAPRTPWIIEEDAIGPLSTEHRTLGDRLPGNVVRLRSYCRAYGLDLRTTVLGGARTVVDGTRDLRSHGTAVNSRILQNALAYLINDPSAEATVEKARHAFASRRELLARAFERRGFETASPDSQLLVWVKVDDAQTPQLGLAAHGVVLSPHQHTFASLDAPQYLRFAVPQLPDREERIENLVDLVAGAVADRLPSP